MIHIGNKCKMFYSCNIFFNKGVVELKFLIFTVI